MIYEMRVYRSVPGKMPILLQRFEDTTLRIWERLGIRPAGFFTTVIGEASNDLTYFLAWDSMEEREQKWGAFMADDEWNTAKAAHGEKYGEVVANVTNSLLAPTRFSNVQGSHLAVE